MPTRRSQKALELSILLFLYFNTFWNLVYFEKNSYAVFLSYFLLIALFTYSVVRHWEGFKAWGIRFDNLGASLQQSLLPLAVLIAACLVFAGFRHAPVSLPKWKKLLEFPAAGMLQQFLFQGFFYNRYEAVTKNRGLSIFLTALTFSLFHLPNRPLMMVTFFGGLFLCYFFSRTRNLLVTGLIHGWISLALTLTLEPAGVIKSYKVGPQPMGVIRKTIRESLSPGARIAGYQSSSIPATFYADFDRPVTHLKNREELEEFLKGENLALAAVPENVYEEFLPGSAVPSYVWKKSLVWKRKFPHRRPETLECVFTLNFKRLHELYRREVVLVGNRKQKI